MDGKQYVIVCTFNRTTEVERLIRELAGQTCPVFIVLVDAGTPENYGLNELALQESLKVGEYAHIRSEALLPHQRQVGVDFVLSRHPNVGEIHFIDDDVSVYPDHIRRMASILRSLEPEAVVLGPRDCPFNQVRGWRLWVRSKLGGRLYKSGLYFPVRGDIALVEVDWLPGNCWTVRSSVFQSFSFRSYNFFFAEDLAASLAWRQLGTLWSTPDVEIDHRVSSTGRPDHRDVVFQSRRAIWNLAAEYPMQLSRFCMLVVEILLILKNLSLSIFTFRRRADATSKFDGHIDFLKSHFVNSVD